MAIQYMDSFGFYGTDASKMLDGTAWVYVEPGFATPLTTDPDPHGTGQVVFWINSNNNNDNKTDSRLALPTPKQKVYVAARHWMGSLPAGTATSLHFNCGRNISNGFLFEWVVQPNGSINLNGPSGLVRGTVSPVMTPGSWFHYETMVDLTTGAYSLAIEGVPVMSGTSSSLVIADTIGIISWTPRDSFNSNNASNYFMKDLVISDTTGSTNNAGVGPVSVYTLFPNGDVSSGWSTTGTNRYGVLSHNPAVDTAFISAGTPPPAGCIVNFQDLPSTVVGVRGIQTMARAEKSDGGDGTIAVDLISGSSTHIGTTHAITTAFKYWSDIVELDPATGSPWTPLAVNAATVKIDRLT